MWPYSVKPFVNLTSTCAQPKLRSTRVGENIFEADMSDGQASKSSFG